MDDSSLQLVSEVGKRILRQASSSKDFLVKNLKQAISVLSQLEQPSVIQADAEKVIEALRPLREAIVKHSLALHEDKDVKLLIAICVTEMFRIMAPKEPFEGECLKGIFGLLISMFSELADIGSPYFSKRVKVLETFSRCKCWVIMLDNAWSDLILQMFKTLFSAVREKRSLNDDVLSIMTQIINEEASQQLVEVILQNLLKEKKGTPSASSKLAVSVIQACSEILQPFVRGFLTSCILDRDVEGNELRDSYHQIIYKIFICSPQMLSPIIPNLVQELLADQVDVRIKAVNLVGKMFVVPEGRAAQDCRLLFVEFLKRFSDKSAEVRKNCLKLIKDIYMANHYRSEAQELLLALEGRMLDIDDRVRIQAVATACELARCNIKRAPPELISQVIERLRDRNATVRKEALKKLMEVYRDYCSKCSEGHMTTNTLFEKIPCEVLMLCYAKDCKEFRSHYMELLLAEELFPRPSENSMHWIHIFSLFKPLHIKALDSILSHKRRFQMELQQYLAQRKKDKEVNGSDKREKRVQIFRKLSASFPIPGKAEEWFDKLDQLKDNRIFDALDQALQEMTIVKSAAEKDTFIKMMRERHPDFDFELVRAVGLKCSYNIFGMEHVEYILNELSGDKFGSTDSCAQLLLAIVGYCPYLLKGSEQKLCMLIEKNDLVRDKLVEVLAKAGSLISVKLSDISHVLKMMCLEGTRKQSKVAVSAIAAIVGSSSDESTVSELCKQLVDRLSKDINIPTVLQSLGCIAQHSVSEDADVYGQIMPLILKKIFKMTPSDYLISSIDTCDCSNLCTLKICALKTLVKSFRPHQETDSNDPLLGLLLKILRTGNTSDIVVSSENDRDQMRLAAAKSVLRLSRRWDLHIAPETFCCTVLMAKDPCSPFRRSLIGKTFKLLKEHNIPSRYACVFALAASDSNKDIQKESSKYLSEFIKEYNKDARSRRASALVGGSVIDFPVYTVVFLLYVLAHDPDFPSKEYWDEQTFASLCSPLFCLIEALVNEDNVNGDPNFVTETFSYLFGLLRAIGKAEDAVDAQSTSNLHILSELGIAFSASLRKGNISLRRGPSVILLPSHFYRASAGLKDLASFTLGEGFIKRTIETFERQITEPTSILSKNSGKNKTSCELPENKKQRSAKHITIGQIDSLTAKTSGVQNATTQTASMTQKRKRVASDESAENLSSTLPRQKRNATVLGKEKLLSSCNNVNKLNSLTEPREKSCNVGRNDDCLKENAEMGSGLTAECSPGSRAEAPDHCCLKETHGSVDLPVGEQNILIPSSDGSFFSGSEDGNNRLNDTHKVLDDSEDNRTIGLETETESMDTLSADSLTDGLVFAAKKPNRVNLQQKVLRDLASIGNMEPTGSNEETSKSQIQGGKNNRRSSSKSSITEVANKNDNVVLRRSQRRRV